MHVKPWLRLREESAARQNDDPLMHDEERKCEGEARSGVLGVEPRPIDEARYPMMVFAMP